MLCYALQGDLDRVPPAWRDVLLGSQLTARVRHACIIDTANDVIDVCLSLGVPVTLLKGISTSDQFYPSGYLRPMGDIDVLISPDAYDAVETEMLRLGYVVSQDFDPKEGRSFHHGAPLLQRERQVWVELHTRLFTESHGLWRSSRQDGLFSPMQVAHQLVASTFHGRHVQRLSNELQLVYIASSWIQDLSRHKVHPSLLPPLFDTIFLLKAASCTLDPTTLVGFPDSRMSLASLYVVLSYIRNQGLQVCDRDLVERLSSSQDVVGALQLIAIHSMLHRYLIGGRYWNVRFPPPTPGRYSLPEQLRKRGLRR
jgi:hypothetical protein